MKILKWILMSLFCWAVIISFATFCLADTVETAELDPQSKQAVEEKKAGCADGNCGGGACGAEATAPAQSVIVMEAPPVVTYGSGSTGGYGMTYSAHSSHGGYGMTHTFSSQGCTGGYGTARMTTTYTAGWSREVPPVRKRPYLLPWRRRVAWAH